MTSGVPYPPAAGPSGPYGPPAPYGTGPAVSPTAPPYAAGHGWAPAPGPWQQPGPWVGWTQIPAVSDEQLRRLPPPVQPSVYRAPRSPDQRPAVIGLATTMAVTAGMLWVSGLSLLWLISVAGAEVLQPVDEGPVFHLLDQFALRMSDGLWFPLYGFPVAAVVSGFLVLVRQPWARIAHTAVGLTALGWSGWWLRDSLLTWAVVALYVGVAVAVLWTPAVGRWYTARTRRPPSTSLVG